MANGCRTFFRVMLGILTGLFLLIGLFMLGFGIALKVDAPGVFDAIAKVFSERDTGTIRSALAGVTDGFGIFMIVIGAVATVISFIGFAGAISGSTFLLVIYTICIFILLGAEIALIVVVAAWPHKLAGNVSLLTNFTKEDVYFVSGNYVQPPNDTFGMAWYLLQNKFECCGIASYEEYLNNNKIQKQANVSSSSSYPQNMMLQVPTSCCMKNTKNIWAFNSTSDLTNFEDCRKGVPSAINTQGCVSKVLVGTGVIPIAIAAVTIGLQVLLIIFAIVVMALNDRDKVL